MDRGLGRPALGGDHAFAGVDPDGDLTGEGACRLTDEIGVLDRDSAQNDPGQALGQPHLDRRHVADAAAKLGRDGDVLQDRLNRGSVDGRPGESPVQIDQMQPRTACRLKLGGLRRGIVAKDGGLRHLATQQADALAVLEVDGGIKDHCALRLPPLTQGHERCQGVAPNVTLA